MPMSPLEIRRLDAVERLADLVVNSMTPDEIHAVCDQIEALVGKDFRLEVVEVGDEDGTTIVGGQTVITTMRQRRGEGEYGLPLAA